MMLHLLKAFISFWSYFQEVTLEAPDNVRFVSE